MLILRLMCTYEYQTRRVVEFRNGANLGLGNNIFEPSCRLGVPQLLLQIFESRFIIDYVFTDRTRVTNDIFQPYVRIPLHRTILCFIRTSSMVRCSPKRSTSQHHNDNEKDRHDPISMHNQSQVRASTTDINHSILIWWVRSFWYVYLLIDPQSNDRNVWSESRECFDCRLHTMMKEFMVVMALHQLPRTKYDHTSIPNLWNQRLMVYIDSYVNTCCDWVLPHQESSKTHCSYWQ